MRRLSMVEQRRIGLARPHLLALARAQLLVVGWKDSDDLPACSADEIDALNAVICETDQ